LYLQHKRISNTSERECDLSTISARLFNDGIEGLREPRENWRVVKPSHDHADRESDATFKETIAKLTKMSR
jgi:hypothetical protein